MVEVALPLNVELRYGGRRLDFTCAAFEMPVVTAHVAKILAQVAGPDIQSFPTQVDGCDEPYEIINVCTSIDCIDTQRSKILWWTEADERPDKVGKPRMVSGLRILPQRVAGHHLFRPKNWEVVLICSETVKNALEGAQVTGVKYRPV
jgi:hypothetical protein